MKFATLRIRSFVAMFLSYWLDNAKDSRERYDAWMGVVAILLFIFHYLFKNNPEIISNSMIATSAIESLSFWFPVLFGLYCVLVMPVHRHLKQEREHQDALLTLQKEVDTAKSALDNKEKRKIACQKTGDLLSEVNKRRAQIQKIPTSEYNHRIESQITSDLNKSIYKSLAEHWCQPIAQFYNATTNNEAPDQRRQKEQHLTTLFAKVDALKSILSGHCQNL